MSRWLLAYEGYDPRAEGVREALCTLGNGYFATRGAQPESAADGVHYPGTYIAGCYDRLPSDVAGHTVSNEDLVNAPNWLPLTIRVEEGPWFRPAEAAARGGMASYRQELDLRRGVLTRLIRFTDEEGRTIRMAQRRIVSMEDPHVAAMETTIVPENWSGRLEIRSALDGRVTNAGVARYRLLNGAHLVPGAEGEREPESMWLSCRTAASGIDIAVAARTRVDAARGRTASKERGWIAQDIEVEAEEGVPVTVEKVAAVFTSRDRAIEECTEAALTRVERAAGFDELLERHILAWGRLWRRCQLSVDREDVQRVLNLHMFHLLQTVSEHTVDLDVGVPARGLHGEAYRGHVFWDELFVLPFFSIRFPEAARALLLYRWRRLPEARWAARRAGHRGAMYPWQSGADGREETQRLHLNPRSGRWLPDHSHLQRHVGLAVAHNVWRFYEATGDEEFLAEYGAEMLLEIARFFADAAVYNRALDRYEIRGVMGPDEYHDGYPGRAVPGLDNNGYTNVLTVWVLSRALEVLALLPGDRREELRERLALTREEIARMEDVSRKMRVVFHDGVLSQFEGYEDLEELDWDAYRRRYGDIRRLDRILEAEGDSTNRYKASKQADALMLFFLLTGAEIDTLLARLGHPPDPGLIERTIAYYLPRTSHGSSLSSLVYAWLMAHVDGEEAWRLFVDTLHGDVDDGRRGTTAEGIHLGAMAGTVNLVQRCYAGITTRGSVLNLDPRLPAGIGELRLGLRYRGHWGVDLSCRRDRLRVELRPGVASPIEVACGGRTVTIEPGGAWETPLSEGRLPPPSPGPAP
ncbi:glycosyl hydrolase family 65 protein [Actinomadura viridis]|uniref:Trehalose/maltose hydrolase-like predicted phosphorylase n=1 Tax=Actinomadura viridis TaxID=58110 RepID=A0A931DJ92_9ACTN|nr:glycoside hydrolase family 65 protein [Actinomadura viridis]MBG6089172.1 trehalose/maltose hydrolase-like predicted phosphorylase [Actinomadura viridis]